MRTLTKEQRRRRHTITECQRQIQNGVSAELAICFAMRQHASDLCVHEYTSLYRYLVELYNVIPGKVH